MEEFDGTAIVGEDVVFILRSRNTGSLALTSLRNETIRGGKIMKVEKVDHIHIYVKDLDKAMRFFSELLGTKFTVPGEGNEELEFKEAMDPLGLELVAPTSPDGVVGRAVERRGEGLAGLSLKVPNIEEATAEMES
jgi:methylmalonyl-CoA/ethylmalonyl-CoA epimerase